MAVPDFQSFFLPMLKVAADGKEHRISEVAEQMAVLFKLSEADRNELLPSGKMTRHRNRVYWSRVHLGKALLLEATARGRFKITQRGIDLLATNPEKLNLHSLMQYPEFRAFRQIGVNGGEAPVPEPGNGEQTPEERLEESYLSLRKELAEAILAEIMKCSPEFFERLVIDLLLAMGYGGSRADAGKAVGKSGDGGIDGIIKEDRLGLDIVYIQAKRWKDNTVGTPEVRAFVGSLVGHGASKGVMITTSHFAPGAFQYAQKLQQKVVLIDGEQLAQLMIDFDVGVTTASSYTVKKIDLDYFGEE